MTAGKRRVLTNHLVAAAIDDAANNDELRVSYFTRTGRLIHWTKAEADKLIKP